MTATARPRGDESVAEVGTHLAARAVASTALAELLDETIGLGDPGRIVVLLEILARLTVTAPEQVTEAIGLTMAGMP